VKESSDDRVRAGEVRFIPLSVGETIRPEDGSGRTAGSFFADLIDDRGIELNVEGGRDPRRGTGQAR